jgi:hypothetical protein
MNHEPDIKFSSLPSVIKENLIFGEKCMRHTAVSLITNRSNTNQIKLADSRWGTKSNTMDFNVFYNS